MERETGSRKEFPAFWVGGIFLIIAIISWLIFLSRAWDFTVDDAYISFRYAKHLSHGQGLVWNVGEAPIEGYSNFLWIVLIATTNVVGLDPVVSVKAIGLLSLLGILYLYWRIASEIFRQERKSAWLAFCTAAFFMLANPATAVHAISGLETMLYAAFLLLLVYLSFKVADSPTRSLGWLFSVTALAASLLRPEAVLASIALFLVVLWLLSRSAERRGRRKSFIFSFILIYLMPASIYMALRIAYFGEIFPLPFQVKTLSAGGIRAGIIEGLLPTLMYIGPFAALIILVIFLKARAAASDSPERYLRTRKLLLMTAVTIVSADTVYLFSSLWMNYGQRFYYPSIIQIYVLAGISLVWLLSDFGNVRVDIRGLGRLVTKHSKTLGFVAVVFLLAASNITFLDTWRGTRDYAQGLDRAHVAIGEALNQFAPLNFTLAIVDAGATPYFSDWRHVDMAGLNDRFVAKNGVATLSYVEQVHPRLVILVSFDGMNPSRTIYQAPFIDFVADEGYARLPTVRFDDGYYLIPFLDSSIQQFDEISAVLEEVSAKSYTG